MTGNRPFGYCLRSRRTRLNPDKGDGTRQRRRTPGLKREEVAQRAGISAEWYVKLEQGRAVSPSAETVEALGRALRLDRVELAHLRSLAASGGRQPFRRENTPDVLRRIVASLPEPAYLTGQRFDLLAWNDAVVVRLAQSAYEERHLPAGTLDNGRLAVLADALEEAGCTDADILDHLRGPGPHVRGCWPVDLCLGKS